MTPDGEAHDMTPSQRGADWASSTATSSHGSPTSTDGVRATRERFRTEVFEGFSAARKTLSPKWFYDGRGSLLFDAICELPEYYVTRAELSIVRSHVDDVVGRWGDRVRVVEPGAGSSIKTRLLLDGLGAARCAGYVPLDIAREHLAATAARLRTEVPWLRVSPVCADFTAELPLPTSDEARRTVVYFPGSTIGNFDPPEAERLLSRFRRAAGSDGIVVVGVDLKKDPALLHAAYNDRAGVTASFNKNVLVRMKRELDAQLDVDAFAHYAFYEPRHGRIEMHLVSLARQDIVVGGRSFHFDEGESIRTECSYKYDLASAEALGRRAGLALTKSWLDGERHFAMLEFRPMR
jgi:dimethylhistidine N-methyltransferase